MQQSDVNETAPVATLVSVHCIQVAWQLSGKGTLYKMKFNYA